MIAILFLGIFVGLPIVEILTFVEVGSRVGGWMTVGLTMLTALLGLVLFRIQSFRAIVRMRESLDQDRVPVPEILDKLGLLLAALFVFVPGFVTDAIGFLLFIPALRASLMALAVARLMTRLRSRGGMAYGAGRKPAPVYEAEYREVDGTEGDGPPIVRIPAPDDSADSAHDP